MPIVLTALVFRCFDTQFDLNETFPAGSDSISGDGSGQECRPRPHQPALPCWRLSSPGESCPIRGRETIFRESTTSPRSIEGRQNRVRRRRRSQTDVTMVGGDARIFQRCRHSSMDYGLWSKQGVKLSIRMDMRRRLSPTCRIRGIGHRHSHSPPLTPAAPIPALFSEQTAPLLFQALMAAIPLIMTLSTLKIRCLKCHRQRHLSGGTKTCSPIA